MVVVSLLLFVVFCLFVCVCVWWEGGCLFVLFYLVFFSLFTFLGQFVSSYQFIFKESFSTEGGHPPSFLSD